GDFGNVKDISTTDKSIGYRIKVFQELGSLSSPIMRYYELKFGDEEESAPEIIRPNDYHGTSNTKSWEQTAANLFEKTVAYIYLDNVVLLHHPKAAEAPEDVTIERLNNEGIKINFEQAYLLNDIDTENINNSERTYKNFFKLLDGTPTQEWERTYRAGKGKLLDLLSNDVTSQYKTPSHKIT